VGQGSEKRGNVVLSKAEQEEFQARRVRREEEAGEGRVWIASSYQQNCF